MHRAAPRSRRPHHPPEPLGPRLIRLVLAALLTTLAPTPALQAQPPVVPGFPNVARTPGELLAGLIAPEQGRTAILAYHNGVLFSIPEQPSSEPGSDFQVRSWDLSDPTAPVELATHGITEHPINAHGYLKSGDYLVLGPNWPPEAPWSFRANGPGVVERTAFPDLTCAGGRGCLFQPWYVHSTWWSYNEITDLASLERNGTVFAQWDHLALTGVVGHPFLIGDLLIYASDQSRTGVATYDVSDPTNPVLLDVLTTGGPGGYWPEVYGADGRLYLVFPYRMGGNGMRVVDATDPSDLRFLADVPLPGDQAMYVQFQDEYAFLGSHKVDMRTFESVLDLDGANVVRPGDGGIGVDTSQHLLPLGNLLVTGGIGPNQGMAIWAHQAAPDTRGPEVGYHRPLAGATNVSTETPITLLIHETLETPTIVNGVTFVVRPLGGAPLDGRLTFSFDDVLTFTPDQPLQPETTYEVVVPADGIRDAAGNGIVGTSWTFSTGGSVGGNLPPETLGLAVADHPVSPGSATTLTATVSDPDGDPLEVRFDLGDGSPKTPWSATTSLAASWAEPGHYRVSVQVRDPSGSIASRSRTVTVLDPPTGPRPTASSPVHCDSAARRVWRVHPDNDGLAAVDADTLAVLAETDLCDDPRSVAATGAELWVACRGDDRLVVVDALSGTPIDTLDTGWGTGPIAVVATPDGTTVVAGFEGRGELRRYDASTRSETARLPLPAAPSALAISPAGDRVLAPRFLSPRDRAEVWEVDLATFALTRTIGIAKLGGEANRDTTASGRGTPNQLSSIALSPDGGTAWITGTKPNVERGPLTGDDLDSDNTVRNVLIGLDLASGEPHRVLDLDNSDSAHGLAFSPLGDYLFVSLQGNDEIVVLDALDLARPDGRGAFVSRLGTGGAPQGLCTDGPTGRLFSHDLTDRTLTALETEPLLREGMIQVASTAVATVSEESMPLEILRGKRVFYAAGDERMSAEGYLSCATCHPGGGHDGRTWDFTGRGEGLRNTTTLRGRAGTGHGNVHWTANFDEIQDFEGDVRGAFGGTGFLDDADWLATSDPLGLPKAGLDPDLDALAAYVGSLGRSSLPRSPWRAPDGSATQSALAGREVFLDLGCASCHAGAEATDSGSDPVVLHDVGTLRTTSGGRLGGALPGIDTPTLRGVWSTAPYLHDGSADTLDDVFRTTGGTVVPAESGTPTGAAFVVDEYTDENNDGTVRGGAYVYLEGPGGGLDLFGVDGGPGGPGALELRFSASFPRPLEIAVGGVVHAVTVQPTDNEPFWRHTSWSTLRIEGVDLSAGPTNSITIRYPGDDSFPDVSLDEIVVSTAADLQRAAPHRSVLARSAADRAALVDFLLQLDGADDLLPIVGSGLFSDGFESGTTSAWAGGGTGRASRGAP